MMSSAAPEAASFDKWFDLTGWLRLVDQLTECIDFGTPQGKQADRALLAYEIYLWDKYGFKTVREIDARERFAEMSRDEI